MAPGTYLENIEFAGKAITVRGHYQPGGDWTLVETTIIDGSQPSSEDEASTVTFDSGEGRNSVLQGLTITGGRGSVWVDPSFPAYTWRGGGGIFIFGSSPTIRHSLVSGNRADNGGSVDGAQGGGLLCFGGNPLIHNSIITANHAEYGGGLVVDYSGAVVRNTVISHNTCGTPYGGAGIWTIGSSSDPIELTNCVIADNTSPTRAGALYVWRSTVSLHNSVIWGNQQNFDPAVFTVDGGQVKIDHSNIEGGAGGDGNINLDPAFSDAATFLLDPGSPCTDAGDPRSALNDPEDPTSAGQARWPATGGLRNDMGSYGGPGSLPMSRVEPADAHVVFIPAAAAAPGASGSFFLTDVEINNPGSGTMSYRFLWLPIWSRRTNASACFS